MAIKELTAAKIKVSSAVGGGAGASASAAFVMGDVYIAAGLAFLGSLALVFYKSQKGVELGISKLLFPIFGGTLFGVVLSQLFVDPAMQQLAGHGFKRMWVMGGIALSGGFVAEGIANIMLMWVKKRERTVE